MPYLLVRSALGGAVELGAARWLGLIPIVAGGVLYTRSTWDLVQTGRGTPAPIDPPARLVARGFYRFTRNPMYVAVLAVLLGEAIVFRSTVLLGYTIAVGVAFHLFVVYYEEPTLRRLFGAAYQHYCESVPRWLTTRRRSAGDPSEGAESR